MTTSPRHLIACLPEAAASNPYQLLFMRGLESDGRFQARFGARGKRFAALRTALRHRPAYLHYDWNTYYFRRRGRLGTRLYGLLFLLDVWLATRLGCRIVWTLHQGESHDSPFPAEEREIQRRFARYCAWIRVMWPSAVERAAKYLGVPPGKLRVQAEGSYVGLYRDDVPEAECRQRLTLPPDRIVLAFVGAIKPYKGVEELLRTFARIEATDAMLVIAGRCLDQQLAGALHRAAECDRRVRLVLGFVPDDDLQLYLKACDAVVLPFRKVENSGSAILAMGFGRAVIAPATGSLPERLAPQPELLYPEGGLQAALVRATAMGRDALREIGARNRVAVDHVRWEDAAALFT